MLRLSNYLPFASARSIRHVQPNRITFRRLASSSQSADERSLPAPSANGPTTTLDVSGEGTTVKLDALGPLVVNRDGSMGRVSNWVEMTGFEKESTLKVLGKRNQARLAALRREKTDTPS